MTQLSKPYPRAPIIEAILDFRVTVPGTVTADTLAVIYDRVRTDYPISESILTGSITLQVGASIPIGTSLQQHSGYRLQSEDRSRLVQVTTAGFTYNRLRPYDRWETFRDEAKRLWQIYQDVCNPTAVTRVGLRYINRLELPGTTTDFGIYLRTVPEIPKEIDTGLGAFFMQLQMPQQDLECMLIINEATAPQTDPTLLPVVLDIDIARGYVWQSGDEAIWRYLELLRDRKNKAFEASITDDARKLFT
jgi:uncharacterized protein (TIGR04255 family)